MVASGICQDEQACAAMRYASRACNSGHLIDDQIEPGVVPSTNSELSEAKGAFSVI